MLSFNKRSLQSIYQKVLEKNIVNKNGILKTWLMNHIISSTKTYSNREQAIQQLFHTTIGKKKRNVSVESKLIFVSN